MSVLITDEIDWTLDPITGDFPPGNIVATTGIAAVVQGVRIRLRMIAGEWFLNLDAGIRYFERFGVLANQALIGQAFDRNRAIAEFRRNLLGDPATGVVGVPGVISVPVLDATFVGLSRVCTITWQAVTAFGNTPIDVIAAGV